MLFKIRANLPTLLQQIAPVLCWIIIYSAAVLSGISPAHRDYIERREISLIYKDWLLTLNLAHDQPLDSTINNKFADKSICYLIIH